MFVAVGLSLLVGQARELAGVVIDEHGEPLPYATVRVKNRSVAAMCDSVGRFDLFVKRPRGNDTLLISYIGYEVNELSLGHESDSVSLRIEMRPVANALDELTVMLPRKVKHKKQGKKHNWALFKSCLDGNTAGETFGYEFHASKNKRLVLDKVGFYYAEGEKQMTRMKFRICVYDMGNVVGNYSDAFVNVLSKPIYFDYVLTNELSGRFEFQLPEYIVLPKSAMVAIEMLEDLGDEYFYYRCNLLAKRSWTRILSDTEWTKTPFATPFFVECIELE